MWQAVIWGVGEAVISNIDLVRVLMELTGEKETQPKTKKYNNK